MQLLAPTACRAPGARRSLANLSYSDGLQKSIDPASAAPSGALADWVARPGRATASLRDDERDADGDGLGQLGRAARPLHRGLVARASTTATIEPKESKYPDDQLPRRRATSRRPGARRSGHGRRRRPRRHDDQDHDGLSNQFEIRPAESTGWRRLTLRRTNPWAYVNPFNPCKPFNSSRCHAHPPFGYYASDQAPPIGPNPPAGYPGQRADHPRLAEPRRPHPHK